MFPDIYNLLNQPALSALVNDHIYAFAQAPQGTAPPYITFHIISHAPHNQLSDSPLSDSYGIQIDCWHHDQDACYVLAKTVRDILDNQFIPNQVIIMAQETDTRFYRISLQATVIYQRP